MKRRRRRHGRHSLYEARVAAGLKAALWRARYLHRWPDDVSRVLDVDADRLVVLSDMHRGTRDRADDFLPCEESYTKALEHYFESGHTLVLLGDCEELWKSPPEKVTASYPGVYEREGRFHARGRLIRIWGNHDEEWASPVLVEQLLAPAYPAGDLRVGESLLLEVRRGARRLGSIFLVHGHQGTGFSDTLAFLARFTVRFVWKPLQHLSRASRTAPSANRRVREKHNQATRRWAENQDDLLLITGHTHRPVFASISILDELERRVGIDIDQITARSNDEEFWDDVVTDCMKRGWLGDAAPCGPPAPDGRRTLQPSLFNSGCCCFNDGRITGIEISEGAIRLVLWSPGTAGGRRVLASAAVEQVFERIT
jgi:UDP-2,3-diacylglucosamine pyrophosphatase LpxH